MSIFKNCKPLVAKWIKLGDPQIYFVKPHESVYFKKGDFGYILVCEDTCHNKQVFAMPLKIDVQPTFGECKVTKITSQVYIKCDCAEIPVIEDGKNVIIGRVIEYIVK